MRAFLYTIAVLGPLMLIGMVILVVSLVLAEYFNIKWHKWRARKRNSVDR